MPAARRVGPVDASAHRSNSSKAAGIVLGNLPHAVAAKRHAGEIETLGIAVEFFHLGIQRGHGHSHNVRIGPMMVAVGNLGHDHHEGPALVVRTQRVRQAYLGLVETVRAALSGAVQKQDDGPLLLRGPVHRQINDIVINGSVEGDGAVEKSGVLLAGVGGRPHDGDYAEDHTRKQVASQRARRRGDSKRNIDNLSIPGASRPWKGQGISLSLRGT